MKPGLRQCYGQPYATDGWQTSNSAANILLLALPLLLISYAMRLASLLNWTVKFMKHNNRKIYIGSRL